MQLKNITKIYHNKHSEVRALDHINLTIPRTGITCIVGPSGCGKTTLLNIMSSIDLDYEGTLLCDGKVEAITQSIQLFENLSILDNLLLVSNDKNKIDFFLRKFQLTEAKKKVKRLSVGEKKRVQVIRSLLSDASYLICDEPTASLDHDNSELIMSLLKDISKELSVVIVTHRLALVEKYADYIIQMDEGVIKNSPNIFIEENQKKIEESPQSFINHFSILFKTMKSRWHEHVFHFGLMFFLVIIVFILTSVFPSLNNTSKATTNWLNGKNVIMTQPVREDEKEIQYTEVNTQYDLYHKEDVEFIKENISGVMGYRIGWDLYQYALDSMEETSYVPKITIKDYLEKLEAFYPIYISEGKNPIPFFYSTYLRLKKVVEEKGEQLTSDFTNFYGQKFIDEFSFSMMRHVPHVEGVSIAKVGNDIIPYELFEDVNLNLIAGATPLSHQEILLSKNVAESLVAYYNLNQIEDLIGQEVPIFLEKGNRTKLFGEYEIREYSFSVAGVTYMQSQYENQVFFVKNGFEKCMVDLFEYDPELSTYQYLYFLIDPLEDGNEIAKQINQLLNSQKSQFSVYNPMNATATETYQNPQTMMGYVLFGLIAIVVLYLMMHILLNQRIIKENHILRRYGYHDFGIQLTKILLILLFVGIVQLSGLTWVCEWLNQMANVLGIADIVSYNIFNYLLSLFLTAIFMVLLEGGLYVIRIKKYS